VVWCTLLVAKNLRQSIKSKEKSLSFEWELPGELPVGLSEVNSPERLPGGTPQGTPRMDSHIKRSGMPFV